MAIEIPVKNIPGVNNASPLEVEPDLSEHVKKTDEQYEISHD